MTSFHLLTSGPAPLALDGRRLGHGLPARPIPLDELAALLLHPSVPATTQQAVLDELVSRAMKQGGTWLIGLAGLRRARRPDRSPARCRGEADLLARLCHALGRCGTASASPAR